MAGTLEHSAPETFPTRDADGRLRREKYSAAADVWSVGAIFFQLLTGELLFDFERERSSTAEFGRMVRAVAKGVELDLVDDAATKVRNERFLASRLALARRRAPPAAYELLEQMLHAEPGRRITAAQALVHPFIQGSYALRPRGEGVFDADIIPKMRRFAAAPPMRRLAVLVEAHLLGPSDSAEIERQVLTFRAADARGEGTLTSEDIASALRAQQLDVPSDLDEICHELDLGREGKVNLTEFVAATMDPRLFCEPKLCRAAFRVLDADGDGRLTQADLEQFMIETPGRAQMAAAIIQSADRDGSGSVDFRHFCEAMIPPNADPSLAEKVAAYMSSSFV